MFLDWKSQYCENDSTTQSNLQIQCNPYQITSGIFFYRTRTNHLKICMETQKTPNSQSSLFFLNTQWSIFFSFFLFLKFLFICLFIYGCVGSSFLYEGFLQLRQVGATLDRGARASHYRGLSCCGAQASDAQASHPSARPPLTRGPCCLAPALHDLSPGLRASRVSSQLAHPITHSAAEWIS